MSYQKKRREVKKKFGGSYEKCGSTQNLEFAHKRPTDIQGRGRGGNQRIQDVIQNMSSYRLLCHRCHVEYQRWKAARGL